MKRMILFLWAVLGTLSLLRGLPIRAKRSQSSIYIKRRNFYQLRRTIQKKTRKRLSFRRRGGMGAIKRANIRLKLRTPLRRLQRIRQSRYASYRLRAYKLKQRLTKRYRNSANIFTRK